MDNLRKKIHKLIEQLSEDELEKTWETVYTLLCDFQVKKAIQEVKDSQQPWDFLTHDEALQFLKMGKMRRWGDRGKRRQGDL